MFDFIRLVIIKIKRFFFKIESSVNVPFYLPPKRAWLIVHIDTSGSIPFIRRAAIQSTFEELTFRDKYFSIGIVSSSGSSYSDACYKLIEICRTYEHLKWAFPWIAEQHKINGCLDENMVKKYENVGDFIKTQDVLES